MENKDKFAGGLLFILMIFLTLVSTSLEVLWATLVFGSFSIIMIVSLSAIIIKDALEVKNDK